MAAVPPHPRAWGSKVTPSIEPSPTEVGVASVPVSRPLRVLVCPPQQPGTRVDDLMVALRLAGADRSLDPVLGQLPKAGLRNRLLTVTF